MLYFDTDYANSSTTSNKICRTLSSYISISELEYIQYEKYQMQRQNCSKLLTKMTEVLAISEYNLPATYADNHLINL